MTTETEKNLVVGIDVGGTGTKIGIVDANGEILARDESIATPQYSDFNDFVDAMNGVVQRLATVTAISPCFSAHQSLKEASLLRSSITS